MRRIFNVFWAIAAGALVFALVPSTNALAGKSKTGSTCSDTDSPTCDCMPLTTFAAGGHGPAIDDLTADPTTGDYVGCYNKTVFDQYMINDSTDVECPTQSNGSAVNLSCGCVIAGENAPNGGEAVTLAGDARHGNWTLKELQISYAFGNNDATSASDFFIGNQNGTGAGTNGGRCYGASGFALLDSQGTPGANIPAGQTAYLELQGTICDSIPLSDNNDEPQKGSYTGSFVLDPSRSTNGLSGFTATGTFVITIDDVSAIPSAYSTASFSFDGYMSP
jgi:hypothetical protein